MSPGTPAINLCQLCRKCHSREMSRTCAVRQKYDSKDNNNGAIITSSGEHLSLSGLNTSTLRESLAKQWIETNKNHAMVMAQRNYTAWEESTRLPVLADWSWSGDHAWQGTTFESLTLLSRHLQSQRMPPSLLHSLAGVHPKHRETLGQWHCSHQTSSCNPELGMRDTCHP